jgi:ubiquinone biosynthesis monooxygenase Coq7
LSPLWYAGSYAIGALTGLAGDRHSLGFVCRDERQVVEHLESHLRDLPSDDVRSRRIVEQMQNDEAGTAARPTKPGGRTLPTLIRGLMRETARLI